MDNHHTRPQEALTSIASNSVSSSPPSTPPRRDRKYPQHLAHRNPGHVPLHRRGTADKYEHLEDLLREAGYKETRIFTPVADKFPADADVARKSSEETSVGSKLGGIGSVVGFLAALMPGTTKQDIQESDATRAYSNPAFRPQPESPLTHKAPVKNPKFTITPMPSTTNLVSPDADSDSSSGSQQLDHNKQLYPLRTNQRSVPPQTSTSSKSLATRALLRHMASAPNIPKDRNNVHAVYGTDAKNQHPPLPSAWLDIVKQAVNSSSSFGVHTGGPAEHPSKTASTWQQKTSSAIHNHKNQRRGRQSARDSAVHLAPHPLTLRSASPGAVTMVNVICKSVPGSRSSSAVRGSYGRDIIDIGRLDRELKGKGKLKSRGRIRLSQDSGDSAPFLIPTMVDGGSMGLDGFKDAYLHDDEDDEEEDEELDLARLLVPPKRQRSIRSLRRHLEKHQGHGVGDAGRIPGTEVWRPEHDSDSGWSVTRGRWQNSPGEQDPKSWGLPGLSNSTARHRGGIPDDWADG